MAAIMAQELLGAFGGREAGTEAGTEATKSRTQHGGGHAADSQTVSI